MVKCSRVVTQCTWPSPPRHLFEHSNLWAFVLEFPGNALYGVPMEAFFAWEIPHKIARQNQFSKHSIATRKCCTIVIVSHRRPRNRTARESRLLQNGAAGCCWASCRASCPDGHGRHWSGIKNVWTLAKAVVCGTASHALSVLTKLVREFIYRAMTRLQRSWSPLRVPAGTTSLHSSGKAACSARWHMSS